MTYASGTLSLGTNEEVTTELLGFINAELAAHAGWTEVTAPTLLYSSTTNGNMWQNVAYGFFIYIRQYSGHTLIFTLAEEYDDTEGAETLSKITSSPAAGRTADADGYWYPGPYGTNSSEVFQNPRLISTHFVANSPYRIFLTDSYLFVHVQEPTESVGSILTGGNTTGTGMVGVGLMPAAYSGQHDGVKCFSAVDFGSSDFDGTYRGGTNRHPTVTPAHGSVTRASSIQLSAGVTTMPSAVFRGPGEDSGEVGGVAGPNDTYRFGHVAPYSYGNATDFGTCSLGFLPNVIGLPANSGQVVKGDTISVYGGTDNAFFNGGDFWIVDVDPETFL